MIPFLPQLGPPVPFFASPLNRMSRFILPATKLQRDLRY